MYVQPLVSEFLSCIYIDSSRCVCRRNGNGEQPGYVKKVSEKKKPFGSVTCFKPTSALTLFVLVCFMAHQWMHCNNSHMKKRNADMLV